MNKQQVRERFREQVFKRDRYQCKFCERRDDLDAHHITDRHLMPNGGYVLENGITLCPEHHLLAEEFHRTGTAAVDFSPNDLYQTIDSSYEIATTAAKK